ncbi:hypothetical protein [Pedobacter sp. Leaf194]|uniref:hypothetical protein n=1 Tax=Pedobacter sp. Leaf194 TaxID=1736297 RepID=UPI000702D07E|nr:hypothetical protein [Pedobacter sp. Leaf194]KQS32310.1 hypothetical protein ASG14_17370 [Pedobacter sp. Leaf194]
MNQKNLVLLAYGRETEYYRAIFCVLSFIAWVDDPKRVRIIIYTDKPASFEPYLKGLEITYYLLTPELLEDMLAGTGFLHRRKVAVIDLTFKNFPESDLLFVDSDTFFIANPKAILNGFAPGKSFMHKREYDFKTGLELFSSFKQGDYTEAFIKFITSRSFKIGGIVENFTETDYSWNSGVLGLNKGFCKLMPDVFILTDRFYSNSKWFVSEQLAFSLILQKRTEIRATDEFILHYWGNRQKILVDNLIRNFLLDTRIETIQEESRIKSTIATFKKKVSIDVVMEQIEIALKANDKAYVAKKIALLILKNPFSRYAYIQILEALRISFSS